MSTLGIYGAALKLGGILLLFVQMFRLAAEPFFLAAFKKEDFLKANAETLKYFLIVSMLLFLVISLFSDFFGLILGSDFRDGLFIIPVVLFANIGNGIVFNLSFWYKRTGKTRLAILVTGSVFVIAKEGYDYDAVGNATVNYLKSAHGNYSNSMYTAQNMATYVDIVNIIMSVLTAFIACVGAISLIVGGIGVMNIMLVSVTERTREIGIRKSLGAKTKIITMQFLTESVILCLIGGLIGVTIGIAGAFAACSIINIKPNITWWLILVALLFSSGVGLFFGIYPARKAAQMSPIDALRSE